MASLNYFPGFVTRGSTDVTVLIYLAEISSGRGRTGVAHSGITVRWIDNVDLTVTTVTPSALTAIDDAHSDGGWFEADGTNMRGIYRIDMPDAAFATGDFVLLCIQETGGNTHDYREVIPIAAGVPVNGTVTLAGTPDVNVAQWGGSANPVTIFTTSIDGFIVGTATAGTTAGITSSDVVGYGDGYFDSNADITRTITFDSNAANPNHVAKIATYTSIDGAFVFSADSRPPNAVVNTDKFVVN